MPFTPLTKEQYQKAIDAGFSSQQIIKNEQKGKAQSMAAPNSAGTNSPPSLGSFSNVGPNLAKVPGQVMQLAQNVTSAVPGGSEMRDILSNFGADMYQPKARAATNAPT